MRCFFVESCLFSVLRFRASLLVAGFRDFLAHTRTIQAKHMVLGFQHCLSGNPGEVHQVRRRRFGKSLNCQSVPPPYLV